MFSFNELRCVCVCMDDLNPLECCVIPLAVGQGIELTKHLDLRKSVQHSNQYFNNMKISGKCLFFMREEKKFEFLHGMVNS